MTPRPLNAARHVMFLVAGTEKRTRSLWCWTVPAIRNACRLR